MPPRATQAATVAVHLVIDDSPTGIAHGATKMPELASLLIDRGQSLIYDNTTDAVVSAPQPVIGYVSHGVNDGPGGLERAGIGSPVRRATTARRARAPGVDSSGAKWRSMKKPARCG